MLKILKFVCLSVIFINILGCVSLQKKVGDLSVHKHDKPIFIHLKGLQGFEVLNRIYSKAIITDSEDGKEISSKVKEVDLDVSSEILLVDRGKALIYYLLNTVRKEGDMNPSDLALPELNEKLKMTVYPNAEVFEVPGKPKTSIYYVPPISLPLHKVKVGDSWDFKRMWLSAKEGIPIQINMKSRLDNILNCSANDKCADISIDGFVTLPTADTERLKLTSQIKGRVLFSLGTGSVVWSSVISSEEIKIEDKVQNIVTCTTNHLIKPKLTFPIGDSTSKCEPTKDLTELSWKENSNK